MPAKSQAQRIVLGLRRCVRLLPMYIELKTTCHDDHDVYMHCAVSWQHM